jgi:hypothetical protein
MPKVTIGADKFVKFLYSRAKRNTLGIKINAERAIDIYTVPAAGYTQWRSRQEFMGVSRFRRREIDIRISNGPEFEDDWYLVMENFNTEPVTVDYEVYER